MLQDPGVGHDTLIEGTGEGSLWCQGVLDGHHRSVQLTRPDTEIGLGRKRAPVRIREESEGRDGTGGSGGGRGGRRGREVRRRCEGRGRQWRGERRKTWGEERGGATGEIDEEGRREGRETGKGRGSREGGKERNLLFVQIAMNYELRSTYLMRFW